MYKDEFGIRYPTIADIPEKNKTNQPTNQPTIT